MSALHQHFKTSVLQILRLPLTTPECFAKFSAGALPATAIVHLHTFTLLGMIGWLGQNCVLNKLGRQALFSGSLSSWFVMVRRHTQQYQLPDPIIVLQQPLSKSQWKSLCKSRVVKWWKPISAARPTIWNHLSILTHAFSH